MRTLAQQPKATQQNKLLESAKARPSLSVERRTAHQTLPSRSKAANLAPPVESNIQDRVRFGHDLSRIPLRSGARRRLQPKLKIDEPSDAHEREADRVAEHVTRMSEPHPQRACACGGGGSVTGGTCDACSKKRSLQRKAVDSGIFDELPTQVDSALAATGRPLDAETRRFFEPRFGYDFSRVRVHVDDAAAGSVRAHAFTVGERIVFAANQYRPTTHEGRRLLAHELTHVIQQSGSDSSGARRAAALQRKGNDDGGDGGMVQVIAKENGKVAVVLVRDGKIVRGYAEITPPPGMTAAAAATQVHFREDWSGKGPLPKVDVIVPPGWGRQATNPAAAVEVMDTEAFEKKSEAEQAESERQAKISELRELYREFVNDYQFHYEKFGTYLGPAFFGNPDWKSDAELLALQSDKNFFDWMQARRRKIEWQQFKAEAGAMGYTDPEGVKEMFKNYRQPDLLAEQEGEKQLHNIKTEPEKALKSRYATPLLLKWMAEDPKPVDVGDGKTKAYVLPLPDGDFVTLSEQQFAQLRKHAASEMETQLNTIENQKELYEFHKKDRTVGVALDALYGAKLEGKTWGRIDELVKEGREAVAKGDLKTGLERIEQAQKQAAIARREWERYLHAREVGAEVTLTGLEIVKKSADFALAVGTGGGSGVLVVVGKGVAESVLMAAAKKIAGERVDWGDVGFEVATHVVTGLVMHGTQKLMALGPKNPIMQVLRENFGAQVATDVVQSVVMDSATYSARRAYEQARGRGQKFTSEEFMAHLKKYLTDPTGLPLDVVKAQIARIVAHAAEEHGAKTAEPNVAGEAAAEPTSSPQSATPQKGGTPAVEPSGVKPLGVGKDAHGASTTETPTPAETPQGDAAAQRGAPAEPGGKASATREPAQGTRVTVEVSGGGKSKGAAETPSNESARTVDDAARAAQDSPDAAKSSDANAAADSNARGTEPLKRPPEAEAKKISELVKDPENVKEVTDPSLKERYDVEIEVEAGGEKHTYRRKRSDKSWCRFSTIDCNMGIDPADQEAINRIAAGEFAKTAGWAVEDAATSQGSKPEEFNFPGIDRWTGGREIPKGTKGSKMPEVVDANVIQVKTMNSLKHSDVSKQYNAGIEGLNQASWRTPKLIVSRPKSRELHMIFDEGTFSELSYGQQERLMDLMRTMTAQGPGNHYPIKVLWFQYLGGRRVPIKL